MNTRSTATLWGFLTIAALVGGCELMGDEEGARVRPSTGETETCAPGEAGPSCEPCQTGTWCPGGDAPLAICAAGIYDHDQDAAAACVPWSICPKGTLVEGEGSTVQDRTCTAYAPSTYTSTSNQAACLPQGSCPLGTVQTAAGTNTSATACNACTAGNYCAGGTNPSVACGGTTWDHDGSATTACVAKSDCAAGTYVSEAGSATTNRTCTACASGSFSTTLNVASCTTWTNCTAGYYVSKAGTATTNRQCTVCPAGTNSYADNATICTALAPANSCAARSPNSCCAGLDNSCKAPGSTCYCDASCVEAGDCCPDYQATCG